MALLSTHREDVPIRSFHLHCNNGVDGIPRITNAGSCPRILCLKASSKTRRFSSPCEVSNKSHHADRKTRSAGAVRHLVLHSFPRWSARGVSQVVFQAGSGSSRAHQSQVAHSLVFPRSLTQGSFQWIISDHRLHALFFPALEVSGVQDVGTVLVDDVEALGAARNFRKYPDSLPILDASSSAVRLVIAPAPAPFFTARIGRVALVTPKITRIPLPPAAWNMTSVLVLVCRTSSPNKRRVFNSCSRSTI